MISVCSCSTILPYSSLMIRSPSSAVSLANPSDARWRIGSWAFCRDHCTGSATGQDVQESAWMKKKWLEGPGEEALGEDQRCDGSGGDLKEMAADGFSRNIVSP